MIDGYHYDSVSGEESWEARRLEGFSHIIMGACLEMLSGGMSPEMESPHDATSCQCVYLMTQQREVHGKGNASNSSHSIRKADRSIPRLNHDRHSLIVRKEGAQLCLLFDSTEVS
jgi:hypothetical protein